MKVLLVEPNIDGYVLMPTMSLAILKAYINEKTEHSSKIVDLIFNKKDWKEHLSNQIKKFKPDLIGLSVLSFNYVQSLEIARFIKKNFNIKIMFGGVHVILSPEEVIKEGEVDIVCIGEGELVLKDILDKNLACKNVKGIFYKKDGKVVRNKPRGLIQDLDGLPFPNWEDFDLKKYFVINNNHLPIMASRGCPYMCTYCSNHALKKKLNGRYVRFRGVDSLIEEINLRITQYYKQGVKGGMKYLFFYDDTFIMDKNFVLEFCRKFKEKGFHKKLKWNVNVRANLVTQEIIAALKDAGCYEVRMGVEAANDYIRNDLYKRNMSKKQIFDAIRIIKNNGLQLRIQFILGAPYEKIEMMEESFDMAKKSGADYILFPILMPLPSTKIKEICEKEDLIEKSKFKNAHEMYTSPVTRTKFATSKQIKNFANKIRNYQMKKYILEGFSKGRLSFLWDSLTFLLYYKKKYDLELDHAFRFTINKYNLKRIK